LLFTSKVAANDHIVTDAAIDAAVTRGDASEVPLPGATFHCEAVPARLYNMAKPLT
jgi:hypothetical protein